jgi:hypothetical protein
MYEDIDDAIRMAEERSSAGFVGCVTVRLDTLKRWRARMQPRETPGDPRNETASATAATLTQRSK